MQPLVPSGGLCYDTEQDRRKRGKGVWDVIEGRHIRLRKAREDDWESMWKHVWRDPEIYQWMLYAPTRTEQEAIERCQRSVQYQKDHFSYFVALRETDEAIGFCALREAESGHYEECGIGIGTAHQGKGYGKEILTLMLELAFQKLGAQDFRYGYYEENVRSRNLAQSFGFVYDHTYEITRPWDNQVKIIDSCLLTREKYLAMKEKANT